MSKSPKFDKARDAVVKLLGPDAKVPDLPANIEKLFDEVAKATEAFDKSREDLEAKLLDLQNAHSEAKNAMSQFRAKLEKEDFNLDAKSDAKKIQQGRKILVGLQDEGMKRQENDVKQLDELDKHVIQLGKYKPSKRPVL